MSTPDEPAELSAQDRAYLESAFAFHPPTGGKVERHVAVRDAARITAETILLLCPPSRERSLALTNLEQAMMWANASIARNGT